MRPLEIGLASAVAVAVLSAAVNHARTSSSNAALAASRIELDRLSTENAALRSRLASLEKEAAELRGAVGELADLKGRVAELEGALRRSPAAEPKTAPPDVALVTRPVREEKAEPMEADTFSVRWTGLVSPRFSEVYTFYTESDDGVRLWVNGQLLIDNWTDHAPQEDSGTIELAAGKKYEIKMEMYENGGGAVARLFWESPSQTKEIVPQECLFPPAPETGNGLRGEYFDDMEFGERKVVRRDATIDFDWGEGSPTDGMAPDEGDNEDEEDDEEEEEEDAPAAPAAAPDEKPEPEFE